MWASTRSDTEGEEMNDPINHPDHYQLGDMELKDILMAVGCAEQYYRGAAIKYLVRYDKKHQDRVKQDEDIGKAIKCLEILREVRKHG